VASGGGQDVDGEGMRGLALLGRASLGLVRPRRLGSEGQRPRWLPVGLFFDASGNVNLASGHVTLPVVRIGERLRIPRSAADRLIAGDVPARAEQPLQV